MGRTFRTGCRKYVPAVEVHVEVGMSLYTTGDVCNPSQIGTIAEVRRSEWGTQIRVSWEAGGEAWMAVPTQGESFPRHFVLPAGTSRQDASAIALRARNGLAGASAGCR